MGDLATGLVISVLAVAAVFVYFGILLGCMSLLDRLPLRRIGGTGARQPLRGREREIVALFSALYARLPRIGEGEYLLRLGAEERTLRVSVWSSGRGIVEAAGRSLEVRIWGEDRVVGVPFGQAPEPESRPCGDPEG
ncbi:MAG: hypothetical protein PHW86_06080 [Candidatus Bipolaricaulis sp.]|nr:hypothetical protein [Candidatus Bipolaricaulis sp.]